ncbi:FkbM family methyltransferase [Bordetella genomosp. 13]|uniref:FkbM family methyltransferase n=1 Tax=Bordetella genomosp. 13 TaxID=463040 RepID=A0A1W6ZCA6_9BORD|nr:FkbM family methyltransferase [Bordetella genomosp. 13]ARP94991.1 FkbM family methyltransferase [Bordetella genomosp. 13]
MLSAIRDNLSRIKHDVIDSQRLYAKWEQLQLKKLLDYLDVDCVFDIGANQGQYAEMLRKHAGFKGYIFSFEPNPHDAAILRKRAQHDDKWIISELAISNQDGTAQFNVMQSSQFSSLSTPNHEDVQLFTQMNAVSKTITVQTERLATTLRRLRTEHDFARPFLKMDTQGYDVNIVKGSPEAVREFVGLQSELAIAKLYADSVDFREAITEYERHGFTLSALVPNNAGHFPILVETDCIMVRSDLAKAR